MRKLAILAFSFSAAVFASVLALPEGLPAPLGLTLGLLFPLLCLALRARPRLRLAAALVCAGLAAGLLWTWGYSRVFFQPAQALDGRTVVLQAAVTGFPRETDYGYAVPVRADTQSGVKVSAVLYTDGQGARVRPGDRLSTVAHCTLGSRTLAGEEITYYTAKGIFLQAQAYGRLDVQRPAAVSLRYWPALLAQALKGGIQAAFPPDDAPLVQALVTGNRDSLTDQFTTSLQRTGLSHMVVVSGMHLSLLAQMLSSLLGKGKRSTAAVTALVVLLFCAVVGSTPSVTRAAVMVLLLQLAPLLGRERDGPTALGFALMLLLAWNPFSAAHVGLQLSFASVAGILMVSDRLNGRLLAACKLDRPVKGRLRRLLWAAPRFALSALSATLGAMVFTVPLVAVHFGYFSVIAPLSNLMTLWAVGLLFLGGLGAGLAQAVIPGAGVVLAIPFTYLARYVAWAIETLGSFAFSALPLDSFYYRAWLVFLYLLLGAGLAIRGRKRLILPGCCAAAALSAALLFTAMGFRSGLSAVVLDVGQGQSVLLGMGGRLALVDCGGDGPDNAGDVAADYIQSMGRSSLDLLVVSHCHADHANGVPQLLRRLRVDNLALPDVEEGDALSREILELAQARGVRVWFVREDTHITLSGGRQLTLFPPLGMGTDSNELGLTVLASAGQNDILLTGDMGGAVEPLLLAHAALPDVELLVVGHHGSGGSTTQELLRAVRPELAVVSVGAGNRYGHPARETLERLAGAGAAVYRTDLQGTVEVRFPG